MKRCPKCNLIFDDSLSFCLEDGTSLVMAEVRSTVAAPTQILPRPGEYAHPSGQGLPQSGTREQPFMDAGANSIGNAVAIWANAAIILTIVILRFALWGSITFRGLPIHIICLVGITVAIIYRRRNPKASLLTAFALGLLALRGLIFSAIFVALRKFEPTRNQAEMESIDTVVSLLGAFVYSFTIILLVADAFAGRRRAAAGITYRHQ